VFAAMCVILAGCGVACGVQYSDPPPGTEFFKKLTIGGDLHSGGTITADVAIEQHNPVNVAVECSLRRSSAVL
jgi:hypothetical protein